jgi:nucleoside phosphorylase
VKQVRTDMADPTAKSGKSRRENNSPQWADIVVVCALSIEYDGLKSVLADEKPIIQDQSLKLEHFMVDEGYSYRILVVRLPPPGAGNVLSGIVTSKLIITYSPWLIISFGIAGTLKDKTVKLEDVVYAYEVDYGDLRKDLGKQGFVWKSLPKVELESKLMSLLTELRAEFVTRGENEFGVHAVLLLSSEAVVRSGEARIRKLAKLALADAVVVEMEAFGVCFSCDWTLYHDEKGPLSLAIKGISDLADTTKNDISHRPASLNAAKWLRNLIEHRGLAKIADRGRFRSVPNVERRHQRGYRKAREDTERFIQIIWPLITSDYNDKLDPLSIQLASAHMTSERPPVFYHWRLTGQGIHWVDFYFLRVFRDLARRGYPVNCLITDEITTMPHNELTTRLELEDARIRVEQMVRSALGQHSVGKFLVWFSELEAPEVESGLKGFVENSGYDDTASRELLAEPSLAGPKEEINSQFNMWFKWIAWSCRHDGVGIILTRSQTRTYQFLRLFGTFQPFFVPTREFLLGGESGKKDCRGLYLNPSQHSQIREWLDTEPEPATMLEFLNHLTGDPSRWLPLGQYPREELRSRTLAELEIIDREWFGISE